MDPMADIREGITYGFRIIQRWLSKERSSLYETDSDVQSYQGNDNALQHAQEQRSDVFDVPETQFSNFHMMSIFLNTFSLVEYLLLVCIILF